MPGSFLHGTIRVLSARIGSLLLGVGISVILARFLGPEGKGLYSLAMLLPTMIVALINLGVGPSTVYHVARKEFSAGEAFGSNLGLAVVIGTVGMGIGAIAVSGFSSRILPGVPQIYLYGVLLLVPLQLAYTYLLFVFHGIQDFRCYSWITLLHSALGLALSLVVLVVFKRGVAGALLAAGSASLGAVLVQLFIVRRTWRVSFGISREYAKKILSYGWKAHLANIVRFLNYRIDMLLVNGYLGATAVGLYSVGVGLVEKLWLIPNAASTVLYPRISAETDEDKRKRLTPLVTRTTLWLTAVAAAVLVALCRPIIVFLYSDAYVGSVQAAQALLIGIVAMAASKPLANDLAGRGRPMLNTYISLVTLLTNVVLNLILIPRFAIIGAAWASTASYSATFFVRLVVYCRISRGSWTTVVLPQRRDVWMLVSGLKRAAKAAAGRMR